MGAKERRERVKQATHQGILAGARQIAQQDGWPALTIRKLADYIEYSPSIVYEYFASKEDILHALLQQGFAELTITMRQAQNSTDDPTERVLRIGTAYGQFAHANPDLYQVMHGLAGVVVASDVRTQAVQEVCEIAQDSLVAWAQANGITLDDPYEATEITWSLLHGLVSLTIVDRIAGDQRRAQLLLEHALQTLLRGWASTAPVVL